MKRIFQIAPVWPNWIMLGISLFFAAEYFRLILTTDTPVYRTFVLLVWTVLAVYWLGRIAWLVHRDRQRSRGPDDGA